MSISDAVFLVTSFSIFDHSVWLILSFRCAHFFSFVQFYWVVVVAQVNLRWSVFVSIKFSQIGSFHELLVLATECFFSFDNFETQSDVFLGC